MDGRVGVSGVLGRLVGRACALGRREGVGRPVGLAGWHGGAGWAMKPSRPRPQRGFLLSFLFLFFFSSPLFEFKFGFGI